MVKQTAEDLFIAKCFLAAYHGLCFDTAHQPPLLQPDLVGFYHYGLATLPDAQTKVNNGVRQTCCNGKRRSLHAACVWVPTDSEDKEEDSAWSCRAKVLVCRA